MQPLVPLHRQEHHPDTVLAGVGQREAALRAGAGEELVRNLDQNAGAVARLRVAAAGSAVRQVQQNLDALQDDVVRLLALDAGHEADAAGVALMARIVQALRPG